MNIVKEQKNIDKDLYNNSLQKDVKISKAKRLDYIDIAKGIGILLMIIGHMPLKKYPYLKNFIYCFHMPLFFIISGFFFKVKDNKECLKYILKKLIIPYIITCLVIIGYKVFRLVLDNNYTEILNTIKVWGLASLYGSGSKIAFGIKPIGAIWFLLALAISTYIINNIYNKKYSYMYILIIAYIGYKTSKFIWLPFSVQAGMVSTLFLYIGTMAKKYQILEKKFNIKIYLF